MAKLHKKMNSHDKMNDVTETESALYVLLMPMDDATVQALCALCPTEYQESEKNRRNRCQRERCAKLSEEAR